MPRDGAATMGEVPRQRELARNLIDSVGYRDAIDFCRDSYWDGVLTWVLAFQAEERTGRDD